MNIKRLTTLFIISTFLIPQVAFSFAISRPAEQRNEYSFVMEPGNTLKQKLELYNTEKTDINLLLYGADAAPSKQGAFAVKSKNETQNHIGNWVIFDQPTYAIPSNESITIEYTVKIPEPTPPGTYAGGIVGELGADTSTPGDGKKNTIGVVTAARYALPLYISIPGEKVHSYEWADLSYSNEGYPTFTLQLKNTGNTIVRANGTITIKDLNTPDTKTVIASDNTNANSEPISNTIELKLQNIELQQGQELQTPIKWKDEVPLYGNFSAQATLEFSEFDILSGKNINTETLTKSVTFKIIPWQLIKQIVTVISILLFLILSYISIRRIIFNYRRKKATPYIVQPGDKLYDIASKYQIKWKKVAKLNKIKPPYELVVNSKILLPLKKSK